MKKTPTKSGARNRRSSRSDGSVIVDTACVWTYDVHHDFWDTQCGEGFYFAEPELYADVPPKKFRFCPYCGGQISPNTGDDPRAQRK